ncbi:MAG: hypothetical protein PW786_11265 [Arachidicoccus sp.]|nr:hypothetical protein [Arachidicoccus sp.]
MEELNSYLLQFRQLNPQQIALVKTKAEEKFLPKGESFSEAGKIVKRITG